MGGGSALGGRCPVFFGSEWLNSAPDEVFDLGELLHAVATPLAAEAALLVAAEGTGDPDARRPSAPAGSRAVALAQIFDRRAAPGRRLDRARGARAGHAG